MQEAFTQTGELVFMADDGKIFGSIKSAELHEKHVMKAPNLWPKPTGYDEKTRTYNGVDERELRKNGLQIPNESFKTYEEIQSEIKMTKELAETKAAERSIWMGTAIVGPGLLVLARYVYKINPAYWWPFPTIFGSIATLVFVALSLYNLNLMWLMRKTKEEKLEIKKELETEARIRAQIRMIPIGMRKKWVIALILLTAVITHFCSVGISKMPFSIKIERNK